MGSTGLTLGKFAPFHKGHELLVRTALGETDHVIIVIYNSPEITQIPLNIRANWIRTIFPEVEVIEAWDGPSESCNSPKVKKIQENYIQRILNGRKITHFYSSEFYGDHMSNALNAVNRIVDKKRSIVPISGSAIRKNPFKYRQFLSPAVYKDFIVNVVFLGAPSTGKSTMAEYCARKFNTVYMPEFGREYWNKNQINRRLTLNQLVEIAEGHLIRENQQIMEANTWLFSDTNAITTYMFSLYYHNKVHDRLTELAQFAEKRYDIVFLCDTDIPYDDTWDRSGEVNRSEFQQKIIDDLNRRNLPFIMLSGNLETRMEQVKKTLMEFQKIY